MISPEKFKELSIRFEELNILVLGDAMLENYLWVDAEHISPEAPLPVVSVRSSSSNPGGAGNVVANLRALGSSAALLAVVGDDKEGTQLKSLLRESGADISMVLTDPSRPTTVKTRIIAHNQQVVRTDWEDETVITDELCGKLQDSIEREISSFDGVIIENYDKGLMDGKIITEIMKLCKESEVPVYVDPKARDFFAFEGVKLIKPNAREVAQATGTELNDDNMDEIGVSLRDRLACEMLLITRGAEGMSLFDKSGHHLIPTRARAVHDVSGAGDTVISTFSLSHLSGATPTEAAEIANFAAGRVCEEVGVVPITLEKLYEIIAGHEA